jgi:predicted deacetylase
MSRQPRVGPRPGPGSVPRLVVSVHDVSPATAEQTRRWCDDADRLGIPLSLLVIPGPWRGVALADAPDYARVLADRAGRGDEIVLHGYTHVAGPEGGAVRRLVGQAVARGAAEFAALSADEAASRLAAGRAVLAGVGLSAEGFCPPGWLASPAAITSLKTHGFRYVTTHWGLRHLHDGRLHRGFALSHRPTGGPGERVGVALLRAAARRGAARGGLVRIALHPDDLSRPALRTQTLRAIESVLAAGGRAMTYGQLADR